MKKTLLVAAVIAGLTAGVAHADDSVVLYGKLNAALGYSTFVVKTQNGQDVLVAQAARGFTIGSGGSSIGFKGNANLVGQTDGIFKLEAKFNVLSGAQKKANILFNKAYFGFSSPAWGTFTVGNQGSASDEMAIMPFGDFGIGSLLPSGYIHDDAFGNLAGTTTGSLKYVSPSLFGLSFGVSYDFNIFAVAKNTGVKAEEIKYSSVGWDQGKPQSKNHVSAGLAFAMGPVSLAGTYDLYRPIGFNPVYKNGAVATPVSYDKNDKHNVQSYTVGLNINISGIQVQGTFAQGFDFHSADFGGSSDIGGSLSASLYSLKTFNGQVAAKGAYTQNYVNTAYSAGLIIPATEQGSFKFDFSGSVAKAEMFKKDATAKAGDLKMVTQLWRVGYSQNLNRLTSIYVFGGYGQVKATFKGTESGAKDTDLGTLEIKQFGLGITHKF